MIFSLFYSIQHFSLYYILDKSKVQAAWWKLRPQLVNKIQQMSSINIVMTCTIRKASPLAPAWHLYNRIITMHFTEAPATYITYSYRLQILNRQTFRALPARELINLTSLVGRFYAGSALNVWRLKIGLGAKHPQNVKHCRIWGNLIDSYVWKRGTCLEPTEAC